MLISGGGHHGETPRRELRHHRCVCVSKNDHNMHLLKKSDGHLECGVNRPPSAIHCTRRYISVQKHHADGTLLQPSQRRAAVKKELKSAKHARDIADCCCCCCCWVCRLLSVVCRTAVGFDVLASPATIEIRQRHAPPRELTHTFNKTLFNSVLALQTKEPNHATLARKCLSAAAAVII